MSFSAFAARLRSSAMDARVADPDFRVPELAAGRRHAHHLGGAEGLLVELDRARGVLAGEVRRDREAAELEAEQAEQESVLPPESSLSIARWLKWSAPLLAALMAWGGWMIVQG